MRRAPSRRAEARRPDRRCLTCPRTGTRRRQSPRWLARRRRDQSIPRTIRPPAARARRSLGRMAGAEQSQGAGPPTPRYRTPACIAAAKWTVIADHVVGPRALVQSIHVLRNERESVSLAPARDQLMAGVGLTSRDSSAPPVIPLPDQLRVAPERLRGRELLRPERSPEATGSTKRRDTACRGNSCACEHRQPARRRDPRRDLSHLVRHVCTMP